MVLNELISKRGLQFFICLSLVLSFSAVAAQDEPPVVIPPVEIVPSVEVAPSTELPIQIQSYEQTPLTIMEDAEQIIAPTATPEDALAPAVVGSQDIWGGDSPFNVQVGNNAIYTREYRIGMFRSGQEIWGFKVYRIPPGTTYPNVQITNKFNRTVYWPIPTFATPGLSSQGNGHMAVIYPEHNIVYEFIGAEWDGNILRPHSMVSFPLNGSGVVLTAAPRTTASGFSFMSGSLIREDFYDPATGAMSQTPKIDHAIAITLSDDIVQKDGFISPAMSGEPKALAGPEGIPLGARFALPKSLNVDTLNVHPLTREILRAARDYGVYISDMNTADPLSNGTHMGTFRIEEGLVQEVYGVSFDSLRIQVGDEIAAAISQHGIYRITVPPPGSVSTSSPASNAHINSGMVDFQWAVDANATWYHVYAAGPGFVLDKWYEGSKVCNDTVCNPADERIPGGNYEWWVQPWGPGGYGQWSSGSKFSTGVILNLTSPAADATVTDGASGVTLRWDADPSADWYGVYITGPSNYVSYLWYKSSEVCSSSLCSLKHLLISNGNYDWYIVGYDLATDMFGNWGVGKEFRLNVGSPGSITVNAPSISGDDVTFNWAAASNAGWYRIYVRNSTRTVLDKWVDASEVCSGATCSYETNFNSGNFTVQMQAWSPGGMNSLTPGTQFKVN